MLIHASLNTEVSCGRMIPTEPRSAEAQTYPNRFSDFVSGCCSPESKILSRVQTLEPGPKKLKIALFLICVHRLVYSVILLEHMPYPTSNSPCPDFDATSRRSPRSRPLMSERQLEPGLNYLSGQCMSRCGPGDYHGLVVGDSFEICALITK
jgi:hypothetical protein